MNIIYKILALTCLNFIFATASFGMQTIFYVLRSNAPEKQPMIQAAIKHLNNHHDRIDAIITQAYQIDAKGNVTGYTNKEMLDAAKEHKLKVYALVTNTGFDKETAHTFLHNAKAEEQAIAALIKLCEDNQHDGLQMDFENIHIKDKEKLTEFYKVVAAALHQKNLTVSFAVVPTVKDGKQDSNFQTRKYDNWSGAYDLEKLGKVADFISIMAYDQHMSGTTPGPTAGITWVEAVIEHAKKFIPVSKISLGIPTYSGHWYTGGSLKGRIGVRSVDIGYSEVKEMIAKHNLKLIWDDNDKINYAMFKRAWLYQYLFVEDARSYRAKVEIARKNNLHGISVFCLGIEDENIWKSVTSTS